MGLRYDAREFNTRAARREAALRELELDELAAGRNMTYQARQDYMHALWIVAMERRRDPAMQQFYEDDDAERLAALTQWRARLRAAHGD
jgi:hypothetical protein